MSDKKTLNLPVSAIGISTPEALSLYHYLSGGKVMHILLPSTKPIRCKDFDICEIYKSNFENLREINISSIDNLINKWGADGLILEGCDIKNLINDELLDNIKKQLNIPIGIRIAEPINLYNIDFIVYDHFLDYYTNIDFINYINNFNKYNSWIEVQLYYKEPLLEKFLPLVKVVGKKEIPVHIYLLDNKGGGAVRELYNELKKVNPYVYIHVNLYGEYITYCYNCKKPVAYREEGVLLDLELKGNHCWNCGVELPFNKVISKKTDKMFGRISNGDIIWYDPRAIQLD
ncbi:hypothetical protein Calag_0460 [Caldisphaera lagunensis DSM 15908]|uniref:Uncharacterized protein n=1 Tax=Caldisphaera lagunensis (strain DSM 15908 / JCM 11604 / ANMR 0165 / IC-154) TaxID=1056495 RepID=L0AAS7_CALLD|nr:hypothetical protein [Caldisphaera lagunensis]AFZ70227.1 hypothetical protein Calag_0460 [Caldisphaera lagunensis DSM 15908]